MAQEHKVVYPVGAQVFTGEAAHSVLGVFGMSMTVPAEGNGEQTRAPVTVLRFVDMETGEAAYYVLLDNQVQGLVQELTGGIHVVRAELPKDIQR